MFQYSTLDPPATLENSGHQLAGKMTCVDELMSMKLDKIKSNYDEFGGMYKQILIALQEKEKREIRYNSVCVCARVLLPYYFLLYLYIYLLIFGMMVSLQA